MMRPVPITSVTTHACVQGLIAWQISGSEVNKTLTGEVLAQSTTQGESNQRHKHHH